MTITVVDTDATTPEGRAAVRAMVREIAEDRAYDPYGSGMAALVAIVDVLWENGEGVPSAIAQPGAGWRSGYPEPEAEIIAVALDNGASIDDVRYFMFVLSRYIDVVRLAGHQG